MADEALSALQLLEAMYPLDGELELSDSASLALSSDGETVSLPLDVVVRVPIDDTDEPLRVDLCVSLGNELLLSVRQPAFMTRSAYAELAACLPPPDGEPTDVIMAAVEAIRAAAPQLLTPTEEVKEEEPAAADDGPLERVWFWFPSLSTRDKRKDLVTYAANYRLSGFVLAGKPALLCVEGGGRAVDRYMADIKSVSWGDIPSFQKKVTEKLRIPLAESDRKFTTMADVTSLIPHHGTYNHRIDMNEVKRFCDQWGVGQDFGAVVMNARED